MLYVKRICGMTLIKFSHAPHSLVPDVRPSHSHPPPFASPNERTKWFPWEISKSSTCTYPSVVHRGHYHKKGNICVYIRNFFLYTVAAGTGIGIGIARLGHGIYERACVNGVRCLAL